MKLIYIQENEKLIKLSLGEKVIFDLLYRSDKDDLHPG